MELSAENVLVGLLEEVGCEVAHALSLHLLVIHELILRDTM